MSSTSTRLSLRWSLPTPPRRSPSLLVLAVAVAVWLVCLQPRIALAQGPVDVRITADNGYGFGYGDELAIFGPSAYLGRVENCDAAAIFGCPTGPESYTVPTIAGTKYLYIVAWADRSNTQGVIGQFKDVNGTTPIYTGTSDWEVYRTNVAMRSCDGVDNDGPPLVGINTQINFAETNKLWRPVTALNPVAGERGVIGEDNSAASGTYPLACPSSANPGVANSIDDQARWMWYDGTTNGVANPFQYAANPIDDYLIFRLALKTVVEAGCMTLTTRDVRCEPGPFGPSGCYRVQFRLKNEHNIAAKYVAVHPNDGGTVTPAVIELLNPITNGQQANREFVWCPPPGYVGTSPSFSLTLMDEMGSGCCARRLTIDLPDCPPTSRCLQVPEASAECVPGAAPGTFELKLYVRKDHNLPRTVNLVAPAPMKISPQPHELGGVSGLFGPITYLVEGAPGNSYPRRACFWINLSPPAKQQSPYDLDGACCSEYVCVQVPYCGLPTPTPNPNPLSLDGATRRVGDGS